MIIICLLRAEKIQEFYKHTLAATGIKKQNILPRQKTACRHQTRCMQHRDLLQHKTKIQNRKLSQVLTYLQVNFQLLQKSYDYKSNITCTLAALIH